MIVLLSATLHTENLNISSSRIGTDSRYSFFEREKNDGHNAWKGMKNFEKKFHNTSHNTILKVKKIDFWVTSGPCPVSFGSCLVTSG